jgi:pimeloyl-ACP methyl ester carboxylesterase
MLLANERRGRTYSVKSERLIWEWDGKFFELVMDWCGKGPTILLLPALSSISTRHEMHPLQERLSANYRTVSTDWPGFGDQPRPRLDWRPETYGAFLTFLIGQRLPQLCSVVAAGHGATYALAHACVHPKSFARLVLLAPTWRGPLPTMMNGHRPFFDRLCHIVDQPLIGPLLYKMNVNRMVIRHMAAGHVYADRGWLTAERLQEKLAVARAPGARFSSVRFVAGKLDPLATRQEFLGLAQQAAIPMLMVYGAQTPSRSRAEMEALAAVPGVQSVCLPVGKLALHEEFHYLVAEAVGPFLIGNN